ncbi:MAG: hypothetical protein FJY98_02990 [Candidatus Liptonbacteria bacterium]|nr:hypothetical protein [Candidatus Liptonbacteria bacterium]
MALQALGLDSAAVINYIREHKPTYPQLEAWVLQQPGVRTEAHVLHRANTAMVAYIHDWRAAHAWLHKLAQAANEVRAALAELEATEKEPEVSATGLGVVKDADIPSASVAPPAEPATEVIGSGNAANSQASTETSEASGGFEVQTPEVPATPAKEPELAGAPS